MEALSYDDDDYYTSLLLMQYSQIIENKDNHLLSDDDKYAQELQLQETLISSFMTTTTSKIKPYRTSTGTSENLLPPLPLLSAKYAQKRKKNDEIFPFCHHKCSHKFCKTCISKYITMKLDRGKSAAIACPGPDCEGILGIEECMGGVVPKEVVTLWEQVICESVIIPSSQRFYCPYKNCSALLMNGSDTRNTMREAECPSCRRLFCVKCKVTWHSGFDCGDFSRMRESEREREDLMVHALAKKNKWRRCPRCGFFVERTAGCLHMTGRCRFQFCYACGVAWTSTHGGRCR
ncbi:hypothetical protein ABFS83_04G113000 [Erythranthe nasuta]